MLAGFQFAGTGKNSTCLPAAASRPPLPRRRSRDDAVCDEHRIGQLRRTGRSEHHLLVRVVDRKLRDLPELEDLLGLRVTRDQQRAGRSHGHGVDGLEVRGLLARVEQQLRRRLVRAVLEAHELAAVDRDQIAERRAAPAESVETRQLERERLEAARDCRRRSVRIRRVRPPGSRRCRRILPGRGSCSTPPKRPSTSAVELAPTWRQTRTTTTRAKGESRNAQRVERGTFVDLG